MNTHEQGVSDQEILTNAVDALTHPEETREAPINHVSVRRDPKGAYLHTAKGAAEAAAALEKTEREISDTTTALQKLLQAVERRDSEEGVEEVMELTEKLKGLLAERTHHQGVVAGRTQVIRGVLAQTHELAQEEDAPYREAEELIARAKEALEEGQEETIPEEAASVALLRDQLQEKLQARNEAQEVAATESDSEMVLYAQNEAAGLSREAATLRTRIARGVGFLANMIRFDREKKARAERRSHAAEEKARAREERDAEARRTMEEARKIIRAIDTHAGDLPEGLSESVHTHLSAQAHVIHTLAENLIAYILRQENITEEIVKTIRQDMRAIKKEERTYVEIGTTNGRDSVFTQNRYGK